MHCIDLGGNITVDKKRKLVVSEGSDGIVGKLLSALTVCENCGQGEAIRATKRNLSRVLESNIKKKEALFAAKNAQ